MELLAFIFTLLCVWFTTKRHILSWPIGIVGIVLYAFVFWEAKLYSDFGLQFVFAWQSIVGWMVWNKHLEDKEHTKVEFLSPRDRISWILIGLSSWILLGSVMNEYTNASAPWVDSFVAIFSLIANWLLAKRKIENWWIWIGVDIIYIFLFAYKSLYLSSLLYLILLFLAYQGLKNWNISYREPNGA